MCGVHVLSFLRAGLKPKPHSFTFCHTRDVDMASEADTAVQDADSQTLAGNNVVKSSDVMKRCVLGSQ